MQTQTKNHFYTLDGLRGIAAIAVVAHHGYKMLWPEIEQAHPWLAVDFFFCLSGFVVAYAYSARLSTGMSFATFLNVRLQRLAPLFLLGMAVGLCVMALQVVSGTEEHRLAARQAMVGIVGLVGLPAPPVFGPDLELYPLNSPDWSLMFEAIANVAMALVWRSGGGTMQRLLLWLAAAFTALLTVTLIWHRLEWGWNWTSIVVGFARIGWSFPLGVLLYRLYARGLTSRISLPAPLLMLATAALLVTPMPGSFTIPYEIFAVSVAFPAIVLLGANASAGPRLRIIEKSLGATSYALYITHYPLFLIYASVVSRVARAPMENLAPMAGLGLIAFTYAFAWLAYRYFDVPVRRWLARSRSTVMPLPDLNHNASAPGVPR